MLDPLPNIVWRRHFVARTALVFIGNVTQSEKWSRRLVLILSSSEQVENRRRGSVADDARFQEILALAVQKRFEWQQVQDAVGHNDESFARRCLRNWFHQKPIKLFPLFN